MIDVELIVYLNDTSGDIRDALVDYVESGGIPRFSYDFIDIDYIREFLENDFSGEEYIQDAWTYILEELEKENGKGFLLLT